MKYFVVKTINGEEIEIPLNDIADVGLVDREPVPVMPDEEIVLTENEMNDVPTVSLAEETMTDVTNTPIEDVPDMAVTEDVHVEEVPVPAEEPITEPVTVDTPVVEEIPVANDVIDEIVGMVTADPEPVDAVVDIPNAPIEPAEVIDIPNAPVEPPEVVPLADTEVKEEPKKEPVIDTGFTIV